jgi:YXWGXW repeat-containing protein
MRTRHFTLAAMLLAILASCASHMAVPVDKPSVAVAAGKPPVAPPAPTEVRPGFVWIDGHWTWRDSWSWETGYWEAQRPGYSWSPGMWIIDHDAYRWSPGRWTKEQRDPCDEW